MNKKLALTLIHKSKNWTSFKKNLSNQNTKTKGDCFELLNYAYLKTDPVYASTLKEVWLLEDLPVRIKKKLNLPKSDIGIDLIAETKNGEYWSIQSKYRSNESEVLSHRELSTFGNLSFAICKNITFGLVCMTNDRSSKEYDNQDKIGFIDNTIWSNLDETKFKRLKSFLKKPEKSTSIKAYKPFPHQKRAIKNARKHFIEEKESRGKLIFPCGAGKSLTGYWIAKELGAKKIMIAVPSLSLVKQTLESWTREAYANKEDVDWICVCSDKTVGKNDDNAVYVKDIGVPAVTDLEILKAWLKKRSKKEKVVFTTYQSGRVISEATRLAKVKFDVGIYDEAHKTVGRKDKLFSHLIFDENISVKKRIFMTATERMFRGSSDQILSMDDVSMYGETFEFMSFKEAINQKKPILCDYKVITVAIEESEYKEYFEENFYVKPEKGKWDDEIEMKNLTSLIALRKAMNKYPIKHAVTFHGSIAKAKSFEESNDSLNESFPKSFKPVETFHITGASPTSERSKILRDFAKSKRSIITNARCLTEGVDVKNIDCVLFADPRRSSIDIVQAIGRALRIFEGKQFGYVVIPIQVYEKEGELEIMDESYKEIIEILRGLNSNDETIAEQFKSIEKNRRSKGNKIVFEVDEKLERKISIKEFEHNLSLRLWDRLGRLNWMSFEEARCFAHSLSLMSNKQWRKYVKGNVKALTKIPSNLPKSPEDQYVNTGWNGWGDFLGTGKISNINRNYRSYKEAKLFVHKLGLKTEKEWYKYAKGEFSNLPAIPKDIPNSPRHTYKNSKEWISMGDWLGTGVVSIIKKNFLSYEKARKNIVKLNFKTYKEFVDFIKKNPIEGIPKNPPGYYKNNGWIGVGHWLGTNKIASHQMVYRKFQDARKFAQTLNLKSSGEWKKYCRGEFEYLPKLSDDIPKRPSNTYKTKGWKNWGDWLGTGKVSNQKKEWISFEKAKKIIQKLKLKNYKDWQSYCSGRIPNLKKPENIPSSPNIVYRDKGWNGIKDFLG